MILIDENREFGIRFGDPRAGIFHAAGVLCNGKYFKSLIF
jgi:hypothetical protein